MEEFVQRPGNLFLNVTFSISTTSGVQVHNLFVPFNQDLRVSSIMTFNSEADFWLFGYGYVSFMLISCPLLSSLDMITYRCFF